MKFYRTNWPRHWASGNPEYPHVLLIEQDWNDYNYYTLFNIRYVHSENRHTDLGAVKILRQGQKERERTKIPDSFTRLGRNFCSLGQSFDYYRELRNLPNNCGRGILTFLNDVALDKEKRKAFEDEPGFDRSLLRSLEARRVLDVGKEIFEGTGQPLDEFDLEFSCQLRGAEERHSVRFSFSAESDLPLRFNVLVGANGTGKTALMGRMALALTAEPGSTKYGRFTSKPLTSRVIAISYNALDTFRIPEPGSEAYTGYKYCGLRTSDRLLFSFPEEQSPDLAQDEIPDELGRLAGEYLSGPSANWTVETVSPKKTWTIKSKGSRIRLERSRSGGMNAYGEGLLSTGQLLSRVSDSLEDLESRRCHKLEKLLARVLPEGCDIKRFVGMGEGTYRRSVFLKLSAGQRIVCSIVCDVVSFIVRESLLLVDEPENHLHPGLLSTLMSLLQDILDEYKSFAIVATHSPVVLQQVPSECVRVFRRVGNTPFIDPLSFECFGEDLQTIMEKALGLAEPELDFHDRLRELSELKTTAEIDALFPKGLGLGARIYLRSLDATDRQAGAGASESEAE